MRRFNESYSLVSNDEKIGFIELFNISDIECRLCRVIISERAGRGKGYGKQLVQLAVEHARNKLNAKIVSLAVFEQNKLAIHCYESIGFKTYAREIGTRNFHGQEWPLLRMKLVL